MKRVRGVAGSASMSQPAVAPMSVTRKTALPSTLSTRSDWQVQGTIVAADAAVRSTRIRFLSALLAMTT